MTVPQPTDRLRTKLVMRMPPNAALAFALVGVGWVVMTRVLAASLRRREAAQAPDAATAELPRTKPIPVNRLRSTVPGATDAQLATNTRT